MIYIVDLDNHVGFLQKENDEVFFVHSSYIEPVAIVKEIAMESEALGSSNVYILGSVLENKALWKDWKSGNNITLSK